MNRAIFESRVTSFLSWSFALKQFSISLSMTSLILLSACILGALADKGCIPANKCYIGAYYGNSGLSDYTQISAQVICQSNGTICRRDYVSSDCSGNFEQETCFDSSQFAYFIDHVDCSGTCTNYVHARIYNAATDDTDCSEIETYQEVIQPLGCQDLSAGSYYYACTENTYQVNYYFGKTDDGACLTDDERINEVLTEGCNVNTTANRPQYLEVLYCNGDSLIPDAPNDSGRVYWVSVSMILTLFCIVSCIL